MRLDSLSSSRPNASGTIDIGNKSLNGHRCFASMHKGARLLGRTKPLGWMIRVSPGLMGENLGEPFEKPCEPAG